MARAAQRRVVVVAGLEHGVVALVVRGADLAGGLIVQLVVDGLPVGGVPALHAPAALGGVVL